MFDHVTIRVSDRDASRRFYETVLAPLGHTVSPSGVWVPETRFGVAAGWWQDRWVVISCLYWLFRHLFALIVLRCRSEAANEVEILVLRHELAVLRRQVGRPNCRPA